MARCVSRESRRLLWWRPGGVETVRGYGRQAGTLYGDARVAGVIGVPLQPEIVGGRHQRVQWGGFGRGQAQGPVGRGQGGWGG